MTTSEAHQKSVLAVLAQVWEQYPELTIEYMIRTACKGKSRPDDDEMCSLLRNTFPDRGLSSPRVD